jgi:hypothetical protein
VELLIVGIDFVRIIVNFNFMALDLANILKRWQFLLWLDEEVN